MSRLCESLESCAQRYGGICLLLAFSFLFNPYLIAPGSQGGVNVRHPASHRATVGASELEKFSPLAGQESHVFVDMSVAQVVAVLPFATTQTFLLQAPELPPAQQVFCASLWVRPPPAL